MNFHYEPVSLEELSIVIKKKDFKSLTSHWINKRIRAFGRLEYPRLDHEIGRLISVSEPSGTKSQILIDLRYVRLPKNILQSKFRLY